MTEQEKEKLRELKKMVVAELQQTPRTKAQQQVLQTDKRLHQYVCQVIDEPTKHNLYEMLGVARFLSFCDKYQWKRGRVKKFFKFYESIKFTGPVCRTRYKLTPIQVFQFASIFGFAKADGRRLTRTAYLFVPRKFSKTTSSAALAVYELLFGENNAQAYIGANSYPQAQICFNEIRKIMLDLDPKQRLFRINREKITFRAAGRDSLVECLSSDATTKDGLNASLVIMDEYSQARDTAGKNGADLKNVLTSSMGTRKEPLTVIITTASDVLDGPFARELKGVIEILEGGHTNDSIFASLFMPDVDDEEDDPATWAKVQPHLGVTVQPDFYQNFWDDAQVSADNMLAFRTKLLNIFARNENQVWLPYQTIVDNSLPIDLTQLKGRPDAMMGIDLSERGDLTAVSTGFYNYATKSFGFHTAYFFPDGAIAGNPNEKMYRQWAADGHIRLTKGAVIDYRAVVEYVLEVNRHVRVLGIGYDAWKSLEMVNMLSASGAKDVLQPIKQTYGTFTAPVGSFEHGIFNHKIVLDDNPITTFCFSNAIIDEDHIGNKKPIKKAANLKIDGVITTLMCLYQFMHCERG